MVGATKRHGLSPQEALSECGRPVSSALEQSLAAEELMPRAEQAWPPISRCSTNPVSPRPHRVQWQKNGTKFDLSVF